MMNKLPWKICCLLTIVISGAAFTSLVIPSNEMNPWFLGMPYTLWSGILVSIALLILVFVGALVHPGKDEE